MLCQARDAFGVSNRELAVLNALLTFHPSDTLCDGDNLIVFPSNRTLCDRAHGMAESTLRRHLAELTEAGLILRHDSPNGKRYAARSREGTIVRAFGFDLRPLLVRATEIARAAEERAQEREAVNALREAIVLAMRDAAKLLAYLKTEGCEPDPMWDVTYLDLKKVLRRKSNRTLFEAALATANDLVASLEKACAEHSAAKPSASDTQSERHNQNSKTEINFDLSEDGPEPQNALTVAKVVDACPEFTSFSTDPIQSWEDLVALADVLHPMIGMKPELWRRAKSSMGSKVACATFAGILERSGEIRNPSAYMSTLVKKAQKGAFDPKRMLGLRPGLHDGTLRLRR